MLIHADLLSPALLAAAAIHRAAASSAHPTAKADSTPVTEADLAANRAVLQWLARHRPAEPVLSEEETLPELSERAWPCCWLLDPLDGTTEFIHGRKEYGVSLARIEGACVKSGVIVAPALGELAWGSPGLGAWHGRFDLAELASLTEASVAGMCEGLVKSATPLRVSSRWPRRVSPEALRVLCSRSHDDADTQAYIGTLAAVEQVQVGACIKFIRLAQGLADYYPRLRVLHEWDIAAGHAIVKAAGGNVYRFGTREEVSYNTAKLETPHFDAY